MEREAEVTGDAGLRAAAEKMREDELNVLTSVDQVVVHSEVERAVLNQMLPKLTVKILPLLMQVRGVSPPPVGRQGIAFVGGYQHPPNVDAVLYFVENVLPLIRRRLPDVLFSALGSNPPDAVRALSGPRIEVPGFVADLVPLLDRTRVGVAPLRYGAGAKGKVATSLSLGLPMVVSPVASEGMALEHGRDLFIADSPEEFANYVVRLIEDDALWSKHSAASVMKAEQLFGSHAARRVLQELLSAAGLVGLDHTCEVRLFGPTGQKPIMK
jgi:O-antigen biosynthesis protein